MNILGIWNGFNSGICLAEDDTITFAVSEERLCREKFYKGFPNQSIKSLFKQKNLTFSDIDLVAYGGYKGPSKEAISDFISTSISLYKDNIVDQFLPEERLSISMNLDRSYLIDFYTNVTQKFKNCDILEFDHHLCHAATAFYGSGFTESYLMTFDGRGDLQSGVIWKASYTNGIQRIKTFSELKSLGFLYGQITSFLGFKSKRHEGKITGLAAYGKKTLLCDHLLDLICFKSGDIIISKQFMPTNNPRKINHLKSICSQYSKEDISFAVQYVLEKIILEIISFYIPKGANLAVSGGVFGNVKLNQKIREQRQISNFFVFPEMGDGGIAFGATYLAQVQKGYRPKKIDHVYLGPKSNNSHKISGIKQIKFNSINTWLNEVAKRIDDSQVVGIFQENLEYGPRALGARSLLFKADNKELNEIINKRLNRTEFMPFAPVCLIDEADKLFEDFDYHDKNTSFMTTCYKCTDLMLKECPAVVHVDKTARPQIVSKKHYLKLYYLILEKCKKTYDLVALANTSFNNHEEPIVCNLDDALKSLKKNNCDCVVTDNLKIYELK